MTDRVAGGEDRVFGACAGGGGTPAPGGTGNSLVLPDPITNDSGGAWAEGTLLAAKAAGGFEALDVTDAGLLKSRYVCVVSETGGIADAATGEATVSGRVKVLFKAGITPQRGDLVYGTTTPGEATSGRPDGTGDANLNPPPAGALVQEIGWIDDASSYGTDQTCLVVIDKGSSRIQ